MKIYVDLDGVLADFETAYFNTFGDWAKNHSKKVLWGNVDRVPNFYADLPTFAGAAEFFEDIEWMYPSILTACSTNNFYQCAQDKKRWVRNRISTNAPFLPVIGGENKPVFMHQPGDVLIDDFGRNCEAWEAAGGIAIKHEGCFNTTLKNLEELLHRQPTRTLP